MSRNSPVMKSEIAALRAGINPETAKGIHRGEAGITCSEAKHYIIGSCSSLTETPGVIISSYNPETKVAGVAHLFGDRRTVLNAIQVLTYHIDPDNKGGLLIDVATGLPDDPSIKTIKSIIDADEHKSMTLRSVRQSHSLCVDSRNGTIFEGIDSRLMDIEKKQDHDIYYTDHRNSWPKVKLQFDGREELNSKDISLK